MNAILVQYLNRSHTEVFILLNHILLTVVDVFNSSLSHSEIAETEKMTADT